MICITGDGMLHQSFMTKCVVSSRSISAANYKPNLAVRQ